MLILNKKTMRKPNKLLFLSILTCTILLFSSCSESDNPEDDGTEIEQETGEETAMEQDTSTTDSYTGTKIFTASESGTDTLTVGLDPATCKYPFTSITEALELTLNFENGIITSGTYSLDIKTEVGTPISAPDVICSIDPTFDENHTGDITISDNTISFETSIGTTKNLFGVTYSFSGTATENSYSGSIEHKSNSLNNTITYDLDSAGN